MQLVRNEKSSMTIAVEESKRFNIRAVRKRLETFRQRGVDMTKSSSGEIYSVWEQQEEEIEEEPLYFTEG